MIACTRKMPTSIPEDGPQLSAEGNFHQHINVFFVLEGLVQPEKESLRRGKQKKLYHMMDTGHFALLKSLGCVSYILL